MNKFDTTNRMYWVVTYNSGATLSQYEKDKENKYQDIDRDILEFFDIYKNKELIFRLHLEKGKRLIYRRRVLITAGQGSKAIIIVGFQEKIRGINRQAITLIFPDGHTEMLPKWKEGIYSQPVIKDFE